MDPLASAADLPLPRAVAPRLPLAAWWREGLRVGLLLRPRIAAQVPTALQLAAAIALVLILEIAIARAEVPGPALFDVRGWLAPLWSAGASALLAWLLMPQPPQALDAGRGQGVAAFILLWWVASVPPLLVNGLLAALQVRGQLPPVLEASSTWAWGVFLGLQAWLLAIVLRLGAAFRFGARRLVLLAAGAAALQGVGVWQFGDRAWEPVPEPHGRARLALTQETFEAQQALWQRTVDALAPQRPGRIDLYAIVFSPYAAEDVFLRENQMVAGVLRERFDAAGRVLQLANHGSTTETLPWATPLNLQRAIEAAAARMDPAEDVLFLYLTSHGAADGVLAAEHWPLQVGGVQPALLREALDAAGIRHRVVAVSACYSGSWVEPLAGEGTLVMTAADADHTSYGCGRRSELTFFGRAVFDEQLRRTRSLEQAFAQAVPVIRRREEEAGKPDGFSNPQIRVGAAIRSVLERLQRQLDEAAAPR